MFANMTTYPIERSMDCHVNNNKQVCLNDGAQKCDFSIKDRLMSIGPQYNDCLQNIYSELYGNNPIEFCKYAFGNQSEIYKDSEKFGWNLDQIEETSFSQNMHQCYADSGSLKEFCDNVYMLGYLEWESSEQLLGCYKKMKDSEGSNISDEDVASLELKVECQSKKSAQDKYECLD